MSSCEEGELSPSEDVEAGEEAQSDDDVIEIQRKFQEDQQPKRKRYNVEVIDVSDPV